MDRRVVLALNKEQIDWLGLLEEFESFEPEREFSLIEPELFERALLDPPPDFVASFVAGKLRHDGRRGEALRSLYAFLLQKRYAERLNLLYFAFRVFDESTPLPDEIVARTPFPHEDGVPHFRHFGDPGYRLLPFPQP